jgi:hypothetical protein
MMRIYGLLFLLLLSVAMYSEWTVIESFAVPEGASGLAYDGEYIYCGIYGANGDEFYRINPLNGSYELLFTNPLIGDSFGMTYDGEYLWITDHGTPSSTPAVAYQLDWDGAILSQFDLPDHYMSGIAWDNGNYWVSTYYDPDGYIYKLDGDGNILAGFAAPDNQPWDLCLANDYLWMADYWGDALYKIDPVDGSLLESHNSEGVDVAGVVFDGEYLWYCDNGVGYNQDLLYKVYIGETGTLPEMELEFTEYYFGMTVIGESQGTDLPIHNNGEGELVIFAISQTDPAFTNIFQPPLIVAPGATGYISIVFSPDEWGEFFSTMTISSDDPQQPEATVNLSGMGYIKYGDLDNNGFVEAFDAGIVLQYTVGIDPAPFAPLPWLDWQLTGADVDGNDSVEAYDASLIMQYVVGIIGQFPVE